jgi:hypothetical protein
MVQETIQAEFEQFTGFERYECSEKALDGQ